MEDDLLADDGQYKDDSLDDLDIDEEAALLGSSDEEDSQENSIRRRKNDDLEYIDEDGNPVEIGENNAEMYEYADFPDNSNRNQLDDDVLEVDVDELESFSENLDTSENTEVPQRSSMAKETRYKKNLISVPLIPHTVKGFVKEVIIVHDHENRQESEENPLFSPSDGDPDESFSGRFETEEESEEENVDDDHRDRFKSERSNIITLTPAKKRAHIPDTLESVITVEETAKVTAFLANEQKKKNFRFRNKGQGRVRGNGNFVREYKKPSYSNSNSVSEDVFQGVPYTSPIQRIKPNQEFAPRKILINPHFRGPRPASSASVEGPMQQNQVNYIPCSVSPIYNQPYPTTSFSHSGDHYGQFSIREKFPLNTNEPVPIFREPIQTMNHLECHPPPPPLPPPHPQQLGQIPPSVQNSYGPPPVQYHPHEHPPLLHSGNVSAPDRTQPPSEIWMTPPNMISSATFHPTPHPGPHFREPPPGLCQTTSVSNFSYDPPISTFSNNSFQNQHTPMPHTVSYQPPVMHQPPISHFNPMGSTVPQPSVTQQVPQSINNQQLRKIPVSKINSNNKGPQKLRQFSQSQNLTYARRQHLVSRHLEKRTVNSSLKTVPVKLPRLDNSQRKLNIQIRTTSPNIKEIPLVENLPTPTQKPSKAKFDFPEEEDEETRELRKKIEEQKLLREKILKRKEERRREMATQRLKELNKRKGIVNNVNLNAVPPVPGAVQTKISMKQRIGLPPTNLPTSQSVEMGKKKIIVVRKKISTNLIDTQSVNEGHKAVSVLERLGPRPCKKKTQIQKNDNHDMKWKNPVVQEIPIVPNLPSKFVPKSEMETINSNSIKTQSDVVPDEIKTEAKLNVLPVKAEIPCTKTPNSEVSPAKIGKLKIPVRSSPKPKRIRLGFPSQRQLSSNISHNSMQSLRFPNPRNLAPPPPFQMSAVPNQPQPGPHIQMQRTSFMPFDNMGPQRFSGQERMQSPRFFCQGPINDSFNPPRIMSPPGFQNWGFRGDDMHGPPMFPPNFRNPRLPFHMQEHQMGQQSFINRRPTVPNFVGHHLQTRRFRGQNQHKGNFSKGDVNLKKDVPLKSKPAANNQQVHQPKIQSDAELSCISSTVDKLLGGQVSQEKASMSCNAIPEEKQLQANINSLKAQSVVIENLSASTNENQLKKMCTQIGPIENLQLLSAERKAVIKFKNGIHASNFQKKYQRFMLDLAMIQVSLLPP